MLKNVYKEAVELNVKKSLRKPHIELLVGHQVQLNNDFEALQLAVFLVRFFTALRLEDLETELALLF